MSFPSEMGAEAVLWIVWNNTTQTTVFSWSRNFTDGSHTRTGKIVFFLKENCCCLICFLFNIYLTVAYARTKIKREKMKGMSLSHVTMFWECSHSVESQIPFISFYWLWLIKLYCRTNFLHVNVSK